VRILLLSLALSVFYGQPLAAQGNDSNPPPHPSLPACNRNDSQLLLPDLVADVPTSVRTALKGGRRILEFGTAVGNIGQGPLVVDGRTVSTPNGEVTQAFQIIWRRDGSRCARHAGFFEYHPAHSHWHFGDFVDYELRVGNPSTGTLATIGKKASFCLLDLERVRGMDNPRQLANQSCNAQQGEQGISVGWKDVYERTLPDQNLDLDEPTAIPTGSYFLVNAVDASDRLWESNESNNRSFIQANVNVGPRVFPTYAATATATATIAGQPQPTPTRRVSRPVRAPRPTRAPRPSRPRGDRPKPNNPSPTPTSRPSDPPPGVCRATCPYSLQQVRLTWYDAASGGLNLSLFVRDGNCPAISVSSGERGSLTMNRWLTQAGRDTGRLHQISLQMDSHTAGRTSDSGQIHMTPTRGGSTFTYTSQSPPLAGPGLGLEFPVVFDLCVNVGDQTFAGRLVCQEKPRGLLCHEG